MVQKIYPKSAPGVLPKSPLFCIFKKCPVHFWRGPWIAFLWLFSAVCKNVVHRYILIDIYLLTFPFFPFLESLSYQIEVLTTSESREEITVVRLSPKAVEAGLRETLRKNFKVSNTESFWYCAFLSSDLTKAEVFGQSIWLEKYKVYLFNY